MSQPRIVGLYRYPIKGMTPERLDRVTLTAGQTLPFDRAYAIENGPGRFQADAPRHLPKVNFLMLMRDERLATLDARFEDETETLTILRQGKQVARGTLTTPLGRQLIEQFISAYMKSELRGAPKIVSAPGHSFSDVAARCVHIVNLGSLRELERVTGRTVDPLRFRPNVIVDGIDAFAELSWPGARLTLGPCELEVFARTQRCEAINVDPSSGARDRALTADLQRGWGHREFGVYAIVVRGGDVAPGEPLAIIAA